MTSSVNGSDDVVQRHAAQDALAQTWMISPPSTSGSTSTPGQGPAVLFRDDAVLGHVDQTAGEVTGVGGLECGVGQTLAGAVGGDEVLQHREALTEIGGDGGLDDLTGGLGHQAAHTGQLAHLVLAAASARNPPSCISG